MQLKVAGRSKIQSTFPWESTTTVFQSFSAWHAASSRSLTVTRPSCSRLFVFA